MKPPRQCIVPGCKNPYSAKGRCNLHYMREIADPARKERSEASVQVATVRSNLEVAQNAYECATTVEARIRFRRVIIELEAVKDKPDLAVRKFHAKQEREHKHLLTEEEKIFRSRESTKHYYQWNKSKIMAQKKARATG